MFSAFRGITLGVLACLAAWPAGSQTHADFKDAVAIGTFDGFYRGEQLQGHLLRDRLGLTKVPASLLKTSFPYRARPYPEEVLFTGTLSFVRFLGGWKPAWNAGEAHGKDGDLAWRNSNGKIEYRWDLVAPRIDPYLKAGYKDLIISLDNVPWDLGETPTDGAYGQVSPPKDLREWDAFIEGLCRHLVKLYGPELPNRWAFRMGTEPNGAAGHTFSGGQEKYVAMYDVTAKAVKRVLPGARFGPGEFSGSMSPEGPAPPLVNHVKLAQHCHEAGVPFDFLANSVALGPALDGERVGRRSRPPREGRNEPEFLPERAGEISRFYWLHLHLSVRGPAERGARRRRVYPDERARRSRSGMDL